MVKRADAHRALPYIIVGALVAVLAGLSFLVITGNQISDREADLATLNGKTIWPASAPNVSRPTPSSGDCRNSGRDGDDARRQPFRLAAGDARTLADPSLRCLAGRPDGVRLATDRSRRGRSRSSSRGSIAGPALEIDGCASGQDAVAGFVTALKDIDGVTRVGVQSSELAGPERGAGVAAEGGESSRRRRLRRTRDFIAKFEIVVAFDAAPVSAAVPGTEVSASAGAPPPGIPLTHRVLWASDAGWVLPGVPVVPAPVPAAAPLAPPVPAAPPPAPPAPPPPTPPLPPPWA